MSDSNSGTELLAAAREILGKHDFTEVKGHDLKGVDKTSCCLFEDAYAVVAVVFYATWNDLKRDWQKAQTSFVELISEHVSKEEQKSWDGYLLLWTSDFVPPNDTEDRQAIQYDTGRVRKLVSAGTELAGVADVSAALLPLLPMDHFQNATSDEGVLARISKLLESPELPSKKIQAVVDAFEDGESLMEAFHDFNGATE